MRMSKVCLLSVLLLTSGVSDKKGDPLFMISGIKLLGLFLWKLRCVSGVV